MQREARSRQGAKQEPRGSQAGESRCAAPDESGRWGGPQPAPTAPVIAPTRGLRTTSRRPGYSRTPLLGHSRR